MKTFFSTFTAILAAAAVIAAVYASKRAAEGKALASLDYLQAVTKTAKSISAQVNGDSPFDGNVRQVDAMVAEQVAARLNEARRADPDAAKQAANDFVYYWRETVGAWGKKHPDWAAGLKPQLDRIEVLASK